MSSRRYRGWLVAALAATAVGIIALGWAIVSYIGHPYGEDRNAVTAGSAVERPLVAAVARTAGGPTQWMDYARVLKLVSDRIGRDIRVRYIPEEDTAVQVLKAEPADLAFVCPRAYLSLEASGAYRGLVLPVIDGTPTTRFALVVLEDSAIRSFEDLRGKRIAVSDKTSLGGWAYLQWLLQQRGLGTGSHFSQIDLGETMDRNVAQLRAGKVDATVVNLVQAGPETLRGLRILEQSGPLPNPPVVISSSMDAETAAELRLAFLALTEEELGASNGRLDGFAPLDPGAFDLAASIAAACKDEDHMR